MSNPKHPHLVKVADAFEKGFVTEISYNSFETCRETIADMLKEYSSLPNVEVALPLAQYWLRFTEHVWNSKGILGRNAGELEQFVYFVIENDLIKELAENPDDANTLASVCMTHSLVSRIPGFRIDRANMKKLMDTWLGREVDIEDVDDIEKMCAMLYGKATWDLYLPDVADLTFMPVHLWQQKLPLPAFNSNKCTIDSAPSILPSDVA